MNISLSSVSFRPSVRVIETVSARLSERLHRFGLDVAVVSQTSADRSDPEPYRVVRRPSRRQLLALVRWADVVSFDNISLWLARSMLLVSRPWVIAQHTWIATTGIATRTKRRSLRHAHNIATSQALAQSLPHPCVLIPAPYADRLLVPLEGIPRDKESLFAGRLVGDKGVSLLLDAMELLAQRGRRLSLTAIGDSAEEKPLRRQARRLGISDQVSFAGRCVGQELVDALHAHTVLVVPLVSEEPFGIVTLDVLARGCVPVVTRSGGQPGAVGACGVVQPRGGVSA